MPGHSATLRRDGTTYSSRSAAGRATRGDKPSSGWDFWTVKRTARKLAEHRADFLADTGA